MTKKNELPDLSGPTRAATAYIGIVLMKFVGRFVRQIWPLLLLWVINPGQITGVFILLSVGVLSAISTGYAILDYYYFDYSVHDGALQVRSGVIKRKEQSIPFERIQSIHIEEPALHRLFRVVRLKVETAGSKEEEGVIEALEPEVAAEIKRQVETGQGAISSMMDAAEKTEEEDTLSELVLMDLVRIGLTRNHFRTAIILLGFSIGFLDDIAQLVPEDFNHPLDQELEKVFDWDPLSVMVVFGVFLVISILITIVTSIFRYYRQRLVCTSDRWIVRAGLISRREWVIPVRKIQEISFTENPFQRVLGIGEVLIKTASSNEVGDEQVIRLSGVRFALFETLLDRRGADQEVLSTDIPEPAYRWRLWLFIGLLPGLFILPVHLLSWGWRIAFMAIWWALTFFWTRALYDSYRMMEGEKELRIERGFGWRTVRWTPWQKMQAVQLAQGIYEQRKGLASLVLSHGAGTVSFPFMKKERVLQLMNQGLRRIEQSKSDWTR